MAIWEFLGLICGVIMTPNHEHDAVGRLADFDQSLNSSGRMDRAVTIIVRKAHGYDLPPGRDTDSNAFRDAGLDPERVAVKLENDVVELEMADLTTPERSNLAAAILGFVGYLQDIEPLKMLRYAAS